MAAGPIVSSPMVADGYVVVAGARGELGGLRAVDGTPAWSTTLPGGFAASPAIDRGRVFVPTLKGNLQAVSLAGGRMLWQRAFGGLNYGSPSVVDGSLVIAAGFPGQSVVRLDAATGATLWETAPGAITNIVGSSPAIAGSQILLGVNGGRFQSLDLATGAAGWHVDTIGQVGLSAPLVISGSAYFLPGGTQAALYAADRGSGATLTGWPVTATDPAPPAGAANANRVAVSSPVSLGALVAFQARFEYDLKADADGVPGLHVMNEYLFAVDPRSASVAWVRPSGQRSVTSINEVPALNLSPTPVVFATAGAPAVVVASSISPTVSAFDAGGAPLWSGSLSAPTRSSPTLANGLLLVASDAGKVHAFQSLANQAPLAPAEGFSPAEGQMVDTPAPTLRWSPAQDDRADALHYEVRVGDAGAAGDLLTTWLVALAADGSTQVTIPRGVLPAGQSYVYAVRARDAQGAWSPWSAPQSFFIPLTPTVRIGDTTYDTVGQAIDAALPGATVSLGPGLLHLRAPIQLPAGVSLAGAGAQRTVLDATGLAAGIRVTASGRTGAGEIRGLTVTHGDVGVQVVDTRDTVLRNVILYGDIRAGIEVLEGASAQVINATFVRDGTGALAHGDLAVRNSILTDNDVGLARDGAGTLASRYNDSYGNHTASYQDVEPGVGDIAAEVAFASAAHQDFHLRFVQATTDRGDPADDFSVEPAPNGGRVNMGAYGNTLEAEVSALSSSPGATTGSTPTGGAGAGAGGCAVGGAGRPGAWALAVLAAVGLVARRRRRGAGAKRLGGGLALLIVALAAPAQAGSIALVSGSKGGASNAATSSLSVSWGAATTAGNLLVAVVSVRGTGTSIMAPSTSGNAWTLAKRSDNGSGTISTAIYYIWNASSQSTTAQTWNLGATTNATISLVEYSGVDNTADPLDLSVASSGSGTTASTSTSSTLAQAAEVAVAGVSVVSNPSLTLATSTYASEDTRQSSGGATSTQNSSVAYDTATNDGGTKFASAVSGALSTSVTWTGTQDWAAVIVTFKSKTMHWIANSAGTFTTVGNWSWSKGGPSNGSTPAATDDVIFDGGGLGNCSSSVGISVNSVELAATYTGTVTMGTAGSDKLRTNNDITLKGGTLSGGGGNVRTNLNSNNYVGDLVVMGGNLDGGGGAIQFVDLVLSSGSVDTGSGAMTVRGNATISGGTFNLNGSATFESQSGTYMQTGGTLSTNAHMATFQLPVEVDGGTMQGASGGTIKIQDALTVGGSSAIVNANGGLVTVQLGVTVSAGTLEAASAGTITMSKTLSVTGGTVDAAGGTITVTQAATVAGGTMKATAVSGAGTVTFLQTVTASGTGTYDGAGGTTTAAGLVSVTASGATFKTGSGTATLSAGVTVSNGTFDATGGTTTVSGAAITVSGGTYKVGTGTTTASTGLSLTSGTLDMSSDGGQLRLGSAQTLSISGGTLQTTGTSQSTYPKITSSSGTYTFTVSGGTLNLNGLAVQQLGGSGMNVTGTSVAFSSFKNVRFSNNSSATSHLAIARGALASSFTLKLPGCAFDTTAAINIATTSTGSTFFAYLDEINGLGGEGDSRDSDGDASPDNGTVDNSATNSSLALWTWAIETDTAGTAVGFPGAAFDWNTFTFYSVYATFSGPVANTDRIYVRTVNGVASYSYDVNTATYGTIVGTPRWDSVNESGSFDVNGNGILGETHIHVLYVATSGGFIFKLIDNGTSLALPGTGSTWHTPFPTGAPSGSVTVKSITSPVVSDGVNLYFGGTDGSSNPAIFGVQIASGGSTCNGTSNGLTTEEECAKVYDLGATPTSITAALSWQTFASSSYIYFASTAKVYRLNATTGSLQSSFTTTGSVSGSVRSIGSSTLCTDSKGNLNNLFADPSANAGTLGNKSGFPYTASGTPALSPPYLDNATGFVYFGDANGKVYKIDGSGAAAASYPFSTGLGTISQAPLYIASNGYLIAGDTAGKVAYVDTSGPTLKYTLTLSGSVSAISYNAAANSSAGEVMVSTSTGGFYYLPKALP